MPGVLTLNDNDLMVDAAADTAIICNQSVLAEAASSLSGDEAQCARFGNEIGLYQHLAKSLDGGDYWVRRAWSASTRHPASEQC